MWLSICKGGGIIPLDVIIALKDLVILNPSILFFSNSLFGEHMNDITQCPDISLYRIYNAYNFFILNIFCTESAVDRWKGRCQRKGK